MTRAARRGARQVAVAGSVLTVAVTLSARFPARNSAAVAPTRFVPPDDLSYVGASTSGTGPAYDAFLRASGRSRLDIYNRWTTPNGSFDWVLQEFKRRPVTGMITWNLPGDGTQASIVRGEWDRNIRARAAEAQTYGRPLFIRLNWEPNGHWYPWSSRDETGTPRGGNAPSDYVAAWRHVVGRFRDVDNATFVWCPTLVDPRDRGRMPSPWAWWPGDDYVGWIGVDAYPSAAGWNAMRGGAEGLDAFDGFATHHHKPLMIAEWALSSPGTGDSPWWMQTFLTWMRSHHSVKAQVYFDYDNRAMGGSDHRLTRFPRAAARYRALVHAAGVAPPPS